jgi:outer membrane immunogenic protein
LEDASSKSVDLNGFEGGGLIGFNYQFKNNLVVGVEASGAGIFGMNESRHFEGVVAVNTYEGDTTLESNYLVTVGPRFGYAFCRWMPYITGGAAFGDIDFSQRFFISNSTRGFFGQRGSVEDDHAGWFAGAGLEYMFESRWRIRAQYEYVDLGCIGFDAPFASPTTQSPADFNGFHEACLREHNFSLAIIYGF